MVFAPFVFDQICKSTQIFDHSLSHILGRYIPLFRARRLVFSLFGTWRDVLCLSRDGFMQSEWGPSVQALPNVSCWYEINSFPCPYKIRRPPVSE